MVKALEHIHSFNAVHRDIKPENMLLQKINKRKKGNRRSSKGEVRTSGGGGSHSLDRFNTAAKHFESFG